MSPSKTLEQLQKEIDRLREGILGIKSFIKERIVEYYGEDCEKGHNQYHDCMICVGKDALKTIEGLLDEKTVGGNTE